MHPLHEVLLAAASGEFPPVDGQAVHLPPLSRGLQAVVSLTGRVYLATNEPIAGLDGFGSALHPDVLRRIGGTPGSVDVMLAATGRGGGDLPARHDLDDHPRVRYAQAVRERVHVHGDDRGLVTVAEGLAGRTEISVEVTIPGTGRELIAAALGLVPAGEPVFAAVTPGNARSLRAFLAMGFQPLGSEVIFGN